MSAVHRQLQQERLAKIEQLKAVLATLPADQNGARPKLIAMIDHLTAHPIADPNERRRRKPTVMTICQGCLRRRPLRIAKYSACMKCGSRVYSVEPLITTLARKVIDAAAKRRAKGDEANEPPRTVAQK